MPDEGSLPAGRRFTGRSATFIGGFTFAGRVVERLGAFGQMVLIASVYGSGFLADRYFIASIVPLIIGGIMGEALSANILPALVRGQADRARLVAGGFWLAAALLVIVTALYLLVAAWVVRAQAPAGSTALGVWWAFAPIGVLLGLGGYLSGVLTYFEHYVWPPFRSAVSTVGGFVLTLLVLVFTHDLFWVAWAVSGGYALSVAALMVEIRRAAGPGALSRPSREGAAAALSLAGGLTSPVLGGLIGGQIFVLIERALASTIGVGAVSTLSYARGVAFTPTIAAQSVALGVYPGMVRAYEARDLEHVRGALVRGIRLTLFLALAFAAFFAAFGHETIVVLLERGAFGSQSATTVGHVLVAFSLGLLGNMGVVFTARVFYAIAYFRAGVWTQVLALAVYGAIALPMRAAWGTTGLAVAFGVAEVTGASFSIVLAARRVGLGGGDVLASAIAPAAARAAVVAATLCAVRVTFSAGVPSTPSLARLAIALAVGAVVGTVVLWRSDWPELGRMKRTVRRFAPVRGGV